MSQYDDIRRVRVESIPPELKALPRWLVWRDVPGRGKIPFQSASPQDPASSTNEKTWSSYERALQTYENSSLSGVGFVLDGSGIVGVDIDKCIVDGFTNPAATALMARLGCQYIEVSPSGRGLRGFGYGPPGKGRRGFWNGLSVELYSTERYLTVTGNVVRQGPLVQLEGWADVIEEIRPFTEEAEETEEMNSVSFVSSASSVKTFPRSCIPTRVGQRNRCLFKLAQFLKGKCPGAQVEDMLETVQDWHRQYVSIIGTKEFSISWAEFKHSWRCVNKAHGTELAKALQLLPEVPPSAMRPGYGDKDRRLIQICMALQLHAEAEPFFISCRTAGELLEMSHTNANSLLKALVEDDVLQLVRQGQGYQASRYRIDVLPSTIEQGSALQTDGR